jgi:hypothetical protein
VAIAQVFLRADTWIGQDRCDLVQAEPEFAVEAQPL